MKRKTLLFLLLMALFAPLAMNGQGAIKANRPLQFDPSRGLLEIDDTNVTTNRGDRDVTYNLVTSSQSDWSGDYVLVGPWNSTTGYAFDGEIDDNTGGITSVTINGNSLSSIGNAPVLTIAKSTVNSSYYSIRINGSDYLVDGTSGLETSSTETNYYWIITYTSNGMQIYDPRWSGGPYYLYFVVFENTSTSSYGAFFATCQEGDYDTDGYNLYYDHPVFYKRTTVLACTPSFSSTSDYISSFSLGSISNTNSGFSTGGYGNFTSLSTTLEAGATASASLTSSSGSGTHAAAVWIDFNDNGTFESSERVGTQGNIGASTTVNISLSIPGNATPGSHTMRVVYQYNTAATSINPCASASYGEGEDYTVQISVNGPTPITMECGTTYSGTLGTSGSWSGYNINSSWGGGGEDCYAFTPEETGSYTFTTTSTGDPDFWILSSYNTQSAIEGWGSGNKTVTLNGGHTYYFVADNYYTDSNSSYTVTVTCPDPPIIVGTNEGTSSYLPSNFNWRYSLTQQLYKGSEIGHTGTINSISFYYTSSSSNDRTIVVYMKMTSANTLSSFDSSPGTTVYSGSHTFQEGWNTIVLSTPFNYDNICNNLLITVDDNTGSYPGSRSFQTYSTGENRALYKYDDDTNFDPTNPPSSPSTYQYNNYIKLAMANTTEYKILTAKSNDLTMGSFSLNPSGTNCSNNNYFVYDAGTTVTLTASATTGNTFVNWTVDGNTVTGSSTTVTMNDHHTVVANFSENPVAVPYTETFESNTWKFVNGEQTNKWYRGSAGAHTGSYGLFVSNDGTNNTYDNGSTSTVYTYKTINFDETTTYNISFDWKAQGESASYDYITVGLVPASTEITAGSTPSGWTNLDGCSVLNLQSTWQNKSVNQQITAGVYKLVFKWWNDGSQGDNPPAAIDNVVVKKSTHTLSASVNPSDGGTISDNGTTISGNVEYNDGTSVTLTANAATGYTFQNWTIDGNTVSGASTTITMDQDHTVVANFTLNQYTISVSANPSEGGTVSGGGTISHGNSCTITAEANECYTFDGWYEGDTQVSSNANYTFDVTASHTLEAHFSLQQYTVTVSTGEGGGTVSGGGTYNCGETANIGATPDECHTFSHFLDSNGQQIGGFNPAPFLVDHDLTITAVFTAKTYAISATADPNEGGTISGTGDKECGTTCELVATPAENYVFDNWTENGTVVPDAGATYSFTVEGARTLVAHFHLDAVNITATAHDDNNNTEGGGTISGTGSFNIGSTCELVATPDAGYEFVNWTENGTIVSSDATYSFNVTVARDLVAHFSLVEYTLTLTADPTEGGMLSASPTGPYHYNDVVEVTATPNSGFNFGAWSDGGAQTHNVTITGDTELIAYFGADHTLTTYVSPIEGGYVTIAENQVSTIGAVTVGSGTEHNVYTPFDPNTAYSFAECIYLASEIQGSGTITSISYNCANVSTTQSNHIEVYMMNLDKASFTGIRDFVAVTASDKVFDGTWTVSSEGWNTIILDKPFQYNGTDNLLIGIHENTPGTSALSFRFTSVANSSVLCFDNSKDMDPTNLDDLKYSHGIPERHAQRANVRLGFGTYHNGESIALTAHANEGYQFVNWTENDVEIGTNDTYTVSMTEDRDYTIYANFERLAKRFITAGDWNVDNNWSPAGAPDITEDVYIEAAATIPSGCVATANEINVTTGSITIADGGQLQHNNSGVSLTAQKEITGYTSDNAGTNWNYYLFSSPVDNIAVSGVTGLQTSGHYDLYKFVSNNVEGGNLLEWVPVGDNGSLVRNEGYIYASRTDTRIEITGTVLPSNTTISNTLTYNDGYRFGGWNLIGNPFVCNAYVTNANNADMDYYVLYNNDESHYDEFVTASSSDPVAPLSALMVQATAANQSVTYSRTAPSKGAGILNIDVNRTMDRSTTLLDRARVRFGEGEGLQKFQFNPNHTKVYIPEGDKDFAVYYAQGAGTIPVNFKAEDNGRYTLDFSTEEIGFNYLHLIDNRNGNDVDLLQTPYYAFDAKSTDFASRFTLIFATGNDNDGNFAFFNNGVWIINNDGKAELQVVDALGRILSSETISGSCSKAINAAPGVYMLRLINGNDVKVQKVVVRR